MKECKKERTEVYLRKEWQVLKICESVKAGEMNEQQGALQSTNPHFADGIAMVICTEYNAGHYCLRGVLASIGTNRSCLKAVKPTIPMHICT